MTSPLRHVVAGLLLLASLRAGVAAAAVYDIYIAAGQSNMDGRAAIDNLPADRAAALSPQPGTLIHYTQPAAINPFHTGWEPLSAGFTNGKQPPFSRNFGPELGFAAEMAGLAPQRPVAIIKVSRGATNLAEDWAPDSGYMYQALDDAVQRALAELAARGDSGRVQGVFWHQGESDDTSSDNRRMNYEANLEAFVTAVRDDLLGEPGVPFVIGELANTYPGQFDVIRAAQADVAERLPGVALASSAGLATGADFLHFDAPSVVALGERMAAEMIGLRIPEPGALCLLVAAALAAGKRRRSVPAAPDRDA